MVGYLIYRTFNSRKQQPSLKEAAPSSAAPLTPKQIELMRATVPSILQEHGAAITTTFYRNMLTEHPELNYMFNTANQVNGHQAGAQVGALSAYASHIDDLDALSPAVELICNKHASLYIQPDDYKIVGKYLLKAIKEVLGDACTDDILDAWAAAYWALADIMIAREGTLYKDSQGWTNWRQFRVARKARELDEITSFYLRPVNGKPLPSDKPGQYISVRVYVPGLKYPQARQYSPSDAPCSDYYRISVKKESGLNPWAPGAKRHPGYVSNVLHDVTKEGSLKRKIYFIHGSRSSQARAFKYHIQALEEKLPTMQVTLFTSTPSNQDQPGVDYHRRGRGDLQ
ncbi:hypothetical protein IFM5058_03927 [Aspergillus udagawae]|nr:hypothetical protein IFM5058_03927 [Aspergillus udagawae]